MLNICIFDEKGSDILRGRFLRGMAAGALLGAAAGMILMPGMDRRTRKRITRAGKRVTGLANDFWDDIKDYRK